MDARDGSLGVVVVGVGSLGSQRAAAAKVARGCRLVGVVDTDGVRALAVAARLGCRSTNSLDEALTWPDVDLVVIATPHADHTDGVEAALAAGKRVLCEKPLAIDPDDARMLADHADRSGLDLAIGFNHRFYPPVRDTLAIVASGGIGRIESVRIEIGHVASPEFLDGWHGDRATSGGGTLVDNGPHACDLLGRLMGRAPESALGLLRHDPDGPPGCEHEAFGVVRFPGGAVGEIHSSWNLRRGYLSIEARGASGWLDLETAPWRLVGEADGRRLRRDYVADRLVERAFRMRHGTERSLVRELESIAGTTRGDHADGRDGVAAAELIHALYESDRRGEAVAIAREPSVRPRAVRAEARARR